MAAVVAVPRRLASTPVLNREAATTMIPIVKWRSGIGWVKVIVLEMSSALMDDVVTS